MTLKKQDKMTDKRILFPIKHSDVPQSEMK